MSHKRKKVKHFSEMYYQTIESGVTLAIVFMNAVKMLVAEIIYSLLIFN